MDAESGIKKLKEDEHAGQNWLVWCCCLPRSASDRGFWGAILLVCGGIWLFSTLGILSAGLSLLGPLLLVCIGLFWLLRAGRKQA